MVNEQDNTIDKIMNGGNDTRVRDDERGIEAHTTNQLRPEQH